MWVRIASAALGIPVAMAIVFAREPIVMTVAVALLSVIGVHEFYRGVRRLGCEPIEWLGWAACILFALDAGLAKNSAALSHSSVVISGLLIIGMITELLRHRRSPVRNLSATLMGALYAGLLFSFVAGLRNHGVALLGWEPGTPDSVPKWFDLEDPGARLVMFLLLVIWACDTGAYFTGRFLGKHKLAPTLSPGKTIEGLIGGLTLAAVVSVLIGGWVGFSFSLWPIDTMGSTGLIGRTVLGLILGLCSVVGDLFESAMKREIGIKDFGAIMPGHGGVLDRFDSLLFAAPALFLFVALTV